MSILATAGFAIGWLLFVTLPSWYVSQTRTDARPESGTAPGDVRKIKATLFYVSEDGLRLVGVERDVAYGQGTAEQARRILEEQLKPSPAPLASAIPPNTSLRALYVTSRGDAFVDLSREISAGHTGGSLDELFTIYSLVNALSMNLPAIAAVQILVDGREVDTLAGHVDLRHPLQKSLKWAEPPAPPAAQASPNDEGRVNQ